MNLSVVIVNWNTGCLLGECLQSLAADLEAAGEFEAEVIVVDNASTDRSIEALDGGFPAMRCIRNRENMGFARATNQGIRISRGRYVLLLNPDTEVKRGALAAMQHFLDGHPLAGAVGPLLLNTDGSLQISAYPEPTIVREAWRLSYLDRLWPVGCYRMSSWHTDVPREVDVLSGACLMLRRAALDQCGLLDERFFIYSEDQDLCRRLRRCGWRLFWLPSARVVHHGGRSTRQVKAEMFVRLYREKVSYFRMHHGRAAAWRYKAVLVWASALRQVLSLLAIFPTGERRRRGMEIASLYRRLLRELPGM